jgi:ABC-2 type transport system ATP-binding protein
VARLSGASKRFGSTQALAGLDLDVRAGEIMGFLGPNGAGKSTAIRALLGLLRLDAGEARVFDLDAWSRAPEAHRRLAYVPGDVNLWPTLTGGEVIGLMGRLRGALDRQRVTELLDAFDLDPTTKSRSYSKGNRQKVALVAALASEVDLLVLDEPTSGLDPVMEARFQREVLTARDRGTAVLLSSHMLSEVDAVCDRVTIVRDGAVVESGALDELRHLTRISIVAEVSHPPGRNTAIHGAHDLVVEGRSIRLSVGAQDLSDVLRQLTAFHVEALRCEPPTLEEMFLRHYEGGRR